ncbi:MAG: hypothetical protein JWO54_498 [Candidatus Saccharibacteria bacterium]|nr:hypothetical protein [Candidatus Saccharibacteria bacterium]
MDKKFLGPLDSSEMDGNFIKKLPNGNMGFVVVESDDEDVPQQYPQQSPFPQQPVPINPNQNYAPTPNVGQDITFKLEFTGRGPVPVDGLISTLNGMQPTPAPVPVPMYQPPFAPSKAPYYGPEYGANPAYPAHSYAGQPAPVPSFEQSNFQADAPTTRLPQTDDPTVRIATSKQNQVNLELEKLEKKRRAGNRAWLTAYIGLPAVLLAIVAGPAIQTNIAGEAVAEKCAGNMMDWFSNPLCLKDELGSHFNTDNIGNFDTTEKK